MDWSQELLGSALWVGKAFIISAILLLLIGFILIKTTRWAAQFWSLAGHYFDPRKKTDDSGDIYRYFIAKSFWCTD